MVKFLKPARLIPHSTQNYTGFQNLPSFFAYAHAFSRYLGFKVENRSKLACFETGIARDWDRNRKIGERDLRDTLLSFQNQLIT